MEVAVELEIIEAIKALVRSNVGVSILPGVAVLGESGAGALRAIPFVDQRLRREIACIPPRIGGGDARRQIPRRGDRRGSEGARRRGREAAVAPAPGAGGRGRMSGAAPATRPPP